MAWHVATCQDASGSVNRPLSEALIILTYKYVTEQTNAHALRYMATMSRSLITGKH